VDLDSARLAVRATVRRIGKTMWVGEPKTRKSRRGVALPTGAIKPYCASTVPRGPRSACG